MYTIGGPSTTIYWGDIIGTLSSQTDLQSTLDDKASLIDLSEKSNGLEKISEEVGKTGWILKDNNGRIPANPVGDYSVDLTWQDQTAPLRIVGATGNYSLAAGRNTLASGMNSTVFGDGSIASAKNSAAFGLNNTSSEDYSFSVGRGNNSSGLQSTTIGYGNTANGISSFAGGTDSAVVDNSGGGSLPSPKLGLPTVPYQTGANSFVFGDSLIAANPNMAVFGSWNLDEGLDNSDLYKVFVVGIGTSNGRQNGLEVFDGSGIERGSVKAPYLQQDTIEADITGKVLITKEYFESAYTNPFGDAPIDGRDYVRNNKAWVLLPAAENIAQVYYKGLVPPPLPQPDPELPNSNMFDTGDVYLHYNLPSYDLIDGNLMDADGNDALWDGNSDGGLNYKQYILQDNRALPGDPSIYVWEEMTFGIQDAPSGLQYNRTLNSWTPAVIQTDAPTDSKQYTRQDGAWVENAGGGGTGLEAIDEGNGIGWRLVGKDPDDYGDIGKYAVDFSFDDSGANILDGGGSNVGATGTGAMAMGNMTRASGDYSIASGYYTTASGYCSTALGYGTTASGSYSIASGNQTTASAEQCHVEGHGNECYGNDGHAENHYNFIGAYMHASHVEGFGTTVSQYSTNASSRCGGNRYIPPGGGATVAEGAHAEGMHTWAYGSASHAEGYGTRATHHAHHAQGTYNIGYNSNIIHEIGIGSSDSSRRNAFEVYKDGLIVAPELTENIIDSSSEDRTLVTREWVHNNAGGTVPLDKQLENADITNMEYNTNNRLTKITYGQIDDLLAGYYGSYNYDEIGTLTSIDLYSNIGIYTLILEYAYDGNGNLISLTRTIPSPP